MRLSSAPATTSIPVQSVDADVVIQLEVRKLILRQGQLAHQLLLNIGVISDRARRTIPQHTHLIEMGILTYFLEPPDAAERETVARNDGAKTIYAAVADIRRMAHSIEEEVLKLSSLTETLAHPEKGVPLQVAVHGLDYFNTIASPLIQPQPPLYLTRISRGTPPAPCMIPLRIFK